MASPKVQKRRLLIRAAVFTSVAVLIAGCGRLAARAISGEEVSAPRDFSFVGEMSPCYLELEKGAEAIRVNCFHIDGVLHIHSNRWAKMPRFTGENWVETVRRAPEVRVEIEDLVYPLAASPINDERLRTEILHDRGYWYAWDGITVVRFVPRDSLNTEHDT